MKRAEVTEFTLARDKRKLKEIEELLIEMYEAYDDFDDASVWDKISYKFYMRMLILVRKGYKWLIKDDKRRLGYDQ